MYGTDGAHPSDGMQKNVSPASYRILADAAHKSDGSAIHPYHFFIEMRCLAAFDFGGCFISFCSQLSSHGKGELSYLRLELRRTASLRMGMIKAL